MTVGGGSEIDFEIFYMPTRHLSLLLTKGNLVFSWYRGHAINLCEVQVDGN